MVERLKVGRFFKMYKFTQAIIPKKMWGVFIIGQPNPKVLWEFIVKVDLNKWNINSGMDPISIRNAVALYTKYQYDKDTFGTLEYWETDPNKIIGRKTDDCDGVAVLTASILYTLGYDVRLAVGCYDLNMAKNEEDIQLNHAFVLLMDKNEPLNPWIIETTGDDIITEMPKINSVNEYYPLISASRLKEEVYAHGYIIKKFNFR